MLLLAFLCALTLQPQATAATDPAPSEVTLVRLDNCCAAHAWPSAEDRIETELTISNVKVTSVHPSSGDMPSWRQLLESTLNRTDATGAILVAVGPNDGVVLHSLMRSGTSGATEYRHRHLAAAPQKDAIEVAAIKTKEAVLAALYQRRSSHEESPKPQPRDTPQKTSASAAKRSHPGATRSKGRLSFSGLIGPVWTPGGVGAAGCAGAAVRVYPLRRWSLGVRGDISVFNNDIKSTNASASVNLMLGRIQTSYLFIDSGSMFTRVGLHVGVGQFHSDGKSNVLPVRNTRATFFFSGLFGELSFRINKRIYIPITLGISALPRTINVRFDGKTEAAFKIMLLEAGIGASLMI